jgi:hypothetical protein
VFLPSHVAAVNDPHPQGVNSGLVVETTADYDVNTQSFVINTPNEGAQKNWISQGLVADEGVIVAMLYVCCLCVFPLQRSLVACIFSCMNVGVCYFDFDRPRAGQWVASATDRKRS